MRDAAAYVCWAVSRAYAPEEVGPAIGQLAPALLSAAVLDREVLLALPRQPNETMAAVVVSSVRPVCDWPWSRLCMRLYGICLLC